MMVGPPLCLKCKNFQGRPVGADDKARCAKKSEGIPDKIYFDAGKCSEFELNPEVRKAALRRVLKI